MLANERLRLHTKELFRKKADITVPELPEFETPEDIKVFLDKIKPLQYVALARVMDPIIEAAIQTPLSELTNENCFSQLSSNSLDHFRNAIGVVKGTDVYKEALEYPKLIGMLDRNRFIDLEVQLTAGAGTAAHAMLTKLKCFPALLSHHAPDHEFSEDNIATIAKRSGRLPWRNAMMSVDQMMALAEMLPLCGWQEITDGKKIESQLDDFKVIRNDDGSIDSVDYKDIENIVIPEGYTSKGSEPLQTDTPLKDIDFHGRRAIGCPLTLLGARMQELWEWYIQGIVDNGCWKKNKILS